MWLYFAQITPDAETPAAETLSDMQMVFSGLALFGPVALVVLALLVGLGILRKNAFAHAPARHPGFNFPVLFLVALIVVFAVMLSAYLAPLLGIVPRTASADSALTGQQVALFTTLQQIITLVLLMVFLLFWRQLTQCSLMQLGFSPRKLWRHIAHACIGVLCALPLSTCAALLAVLVTLLLKQDPPDAGHIMLTFMKEPQEAWVLALFIISAVILAPISEEILYRGIVQTTFVNMFSGTDTPGDQPLFILTARWWAILFTASIFMFIHVSAVPIQNLPSLFIVGVMFGYLYERTGSLWSCITAHALFNALNVMLLFITSSSDAPAL